MLGYDSEFARKIITGEWRPKRHAPAAAFGRALYARLTRFHTVEWMHVDSHTGHPLNELADDLAGSGADGIYSRPPPRRGHVPLAP